MEIDGIRSEFTAGVGKSNYRILVVEDEMTQQLFLESLFRSFADQGEGVALTWAETASEALEQLRKAGRFPRDPFDLVITDIFLDGKITGVDLRKICQNIYPTMPVLVVSALPFDKFKDFSSDEELLSVDYLEKPVDPLHFKQQVLRMMRRDGFLLGT